MDSKQKIFLEIRTFNGEESIGLSKDLEGIEKQVIEEAAIKFMNEKKVNECFITIPDTKTSFAYYEGKLWSDEDIEKNRRERIETLELDKWSQPNEKNVVTHVGMITEKEAFEMLCRHLGRNNLLPDEYFLPSYSSKQHKGVNELPDFNDAICHVNFGGSEGIYLDIYLRINHEGSEKLISFATGKTLGETAEDFYRMSRIGAECSIMLNGRGSSIAISPSYKNNKIDHERYVSIEKENQDETLNANNEEEEEESI